MGTGLFWTETWPGPSKTTASIEESGLYDIVDVLYGSGLLYRLGSRSLSEKAVYRWLLSWLQRGARLFFLCPSLP